MKRCEYCGKEYDPDFEEDSFSIDCSFLTYRNIKKNLCADCALQALDDE